MKRPPTDPQSLLDRLSAAQGKQYWRCLEELAGEPAFQEMLQREFPSQAGEWTDPVSRRRFLTLMGASIALASMSGCTRPTGTIMPYVRQPENIVLGKPLFYATSMTLGGFATGMLVESHEGRPTKIEGNPQHPASRGATSAIGQAAILGLYDPDRARSVTYRGRPRTWEAVEAELRNRLDPRPGRAKGQRVALLTESIASPTLHEQIITFLKDYPQAKWYQYEPVSRDNITAGMRLAFGRAYNSYFKVDKADVIVALGSDFLGFGPAHLSYTRDFSERRRSPEKMNRLYSIETDLTITGAKADNRLALKPSRIEAFARALAARLNVSGFKAPTLEGQEDRWLTEIVLDLKSRQSGNTLVIAGEGQPAAVHALVHAINHKLGNIGSTVIFTEPLTPDLVSSMASLDQLYFEIDKGEIDTLLILGGNPAYTAPADKPFGELLARQLKNKPADQWLAIHLGPYFDETARLCHWHIPESHFLEAWSDGVAFDGTASIVQPLIQPLYASKSIHDVLAALTRRKVGDHSGEQTYDDRPTYDLVRDYWRRNRPASAAKTDFERFWRQALHDGLIAGTARPAMTPTLQAGLADDPRMKPTPPPGKGYELVFAPDPGVYDGRFGNNGWLQEWPRPITRLTWDNAVLMSPETAKKLKVKTRIGQWRGGEHGETIADMVTLKNGRYQVRAAVFIVPGHADGALTLHLGFGRTQAGRVGSDVGFDANKLRLHSSPWLANVEVVRSSRDKHHLACVQAHHSMEGRDIVRSGTVEEYHKDPHFAQRHEDHEEHKALKRIPLSTRPGNAHKYNGYKWGMAIDLTACTGCGACVVACQAENNSPVVGKEQVTRGREMHWLRIDRYYSTPRSEEAEPSADQLSLHFQPVLCQHCENAPCELVCPVEATVHGDEGTNDMVYNRCVGTRYCANNCPYKVRRFNFLQFSDYTTPSLRLAYNPDVTVRTRGVMEKCTFCIQRISHARIEASKSALDGNKKRVDESRPGLPKIFDGEVLTACQAACPAEAIVFGDLNDKSSRAHALHESALHYDLLGELGTKPRVAYLTALRNPNLALEPK
jgi:MoCo/4Fe-4S cofactor protein with predicted Tat translocation signal